MHDLTADQISLVPKIDLSRRLFAVTSLAAGFASAVSPVGAATITTDAAGLDTGEAKVRVHDGEIPAYYARPKGTGPFPEPKPGTHLQPMGEKQRRPACPDRAGAEHGDRASFGHGCPPLSRDTPDGSRGRHC